MKGLADPLDGTGFPPILVRAAWTRDCHSARIVAVCQCHHCEKPLILGFGAEVRRQKRFYAGEGDIGGLCRSEVLLIRGCWPPYRRPAGPHPKSRGRAAGMLWAARRGKRPGSVVHALAGTSLRRPHLVRCCSANSWGGLRRGHSSLHQCAWVMALSAFVNGLRLDVH